MPCREIKATSLPPSRYSELTRLLPSKSILRPFETAVQHDDFSAVSRKPLIPGRADNSRMDSKNPKFANGLTQALLCLDRKMNSWRRTQELPR